MKQKRVGFHLLQPPLCSYRGHTLTKVNILIQLVFRGSTGGVGGKVRKGLSIPIFWLKMGILQKNSLSIKRIKQNKTKFLSAIPEYDEIIKAPLP